MKAVLIFTLLLFLQLSAVGQDAKIEGLAPFNDRGYYDKFRKMDSLKVNMLKPGRDSVFTKLENRNSMRVFKVPDKKMANMPRMKIEEDFHYTMRIKRYDLNYPYTRVIKPRDSIPSNELKLYQPLNRKQERE